MKHAHWLVALTVICMAAVTAARAQSSEAAVSAAPAQAGVPIEQIVALVAKKTGKRFVLDPRVHANVVLIGTAPAELTYADLLSVLYLHGFAAVEDGRLVEIVPDANIRQQVIPTITAKDTRPGSEYVCQVLTVKNVSAAQLIPILRPMIVQAGHLAAYPASNTLIMCDRFDNVRRLESIIRTMDSAQIAKPHSGAESTEPAAGH